MQKLLIILFCLALSQLANAQMAPKEGSLLNYRIVGFSFPGKQNVEKYKIEIAKGSYRSVDSFTRNIDIRAYSRESRKIVEVPYFGTQYTWRVIYNTGAKKDSTPLYHFSTLINSHVDTTKLHLRILQQAADPYKNCYVSVDAGGVLYDMNGAPVWFIPDTNGYNGNVADIKFTQQGTITFMNRNAYEINYNGDIVWKAPNKGVLSGDTVHGEMFHHEFSKLSNGHYLVLGMQFLKCETVELKDSTYVIVTNNRPGMKNQGKDAGKFGTLIEYDEKGNIVWSWKSSQYLIGSDFDYYKAPDSNIRFDPHDNAFFFDEKNSCIYLGYRNLNRIIKIDYPSGKVLSTYGENFKPGVQGIGSGLFCNQHNIGRTHDGYLYFFNNNSCSRKDSLPTIVMLQEAKPGNDGLKKIWEYQCTIDGFYPALYPKTFGSGGNVKELDNGDFFVNMGTQYSKLFIVTRKKKLLWSALPERFMEPDDKWTAIHEYRANIITRKELEHLIWVAESIDAGK